MVLTLEVNVPEADQLGEGRRFQLRRRAATIGRQEDNDWVLPKSIVSAHHARIDWRAGQYFLTDTSTNGVFINTRSNRLDAGAAYLIKQGDLIIIEPYRIQVTLSDGPNPDGADLLRPREADDGGGLGFRTAGDPFSAEEIFPGGTSTGSGIVDPLELLGGKPRKVSPPVPRAEDLDAQPGIRAHFRPPAVVIGGGDPAMIPETYDPFNGESSESAAPSAQGVRPIRPESKPAPPPAEGIDRAEAPVDRSELKAVLEGAGLADVDVTPELAARVGAILKVVVAGLMDALQTRQQIKDEFRVRATRFRPTENNPLKFSVNIEDALHNLLVKRNAAYLPPEEAFQDAFNDLKHHQIAVLAGVRAAFESALGTFKPEALERQFARHVKKKSLLGAAPESQYWELYRSWVKELEQDSEGTFRKVFGDSFAKTYEAELERLKGQQRRGTL